MTDQDPPVLDARTTSVVAVVAFILGLLGMSGFIWTFTVNRDVMQVMQILENRDVKVINQHTKRIKEIGTWEQKITDLETKIADLEGQVTELKAEASADGDEAAAPE